MLEVEAEDAGIYECVVDNSGRPVIQTHQLVISSPGLVSWCSEVVRAAPGHTAVLQCSVSGHPPPAVSWARAGVTVDMERGRNSSYLLTSVTRQDGGLYTCTAHNEAGTGQCNTTLVIQDPPLVSIQETWTVYTS